MKLSPRFCGWFLGTLSGLLLPLAVHANALEGIISTVAGPLTASPAGEGDVGVIYTNVMLLIVGIADVVGIGYIAAAGLNLIASDSEDQIGKARKTIVAVGAALMLINLAGPLSNALSGMGEGAAEVISEEVLGIIDFFISLVGILAVLALIVSGIRATISYGSEDGWTHLKRSIFGVIAGILLIGARAFFADAIALSKEPSPIIEVVVLVLNIVLGFIAFVATVVILYAGLMMIVSIGNADRGTKAKDLILRVAIGLIIILASMAIVNFVIA